MKMGTTSLQRTIASERSPRCAEVMKGLTFGLTTLIGFRRLKYRHKQLCLEDSRGVKGAGKSRDYKLIVQKSTQF